MSRGLEVCDAVVQRGSVQIRATLQVGPGEVVALTGANGAGKSTLLHAIAGLLPLSAGEVWLDGRVLDGDGDWVAPQQRQIGLVPQAHVLFDRLSVVENVAFGRRSRGVPRPQARAEAAEWLARLDITELADRRAGRLSGGQAQRVALARALCARPQLVLLDEPFSALDAASRPGVRLMVSRVLAQVGVPVVLVTHDEAEAAELADRVVELPG